MSVLEVATKQTSRRTDVVPSFALCMRAHRVTFIVTYLSTKHKFAFDLNGEVKASLLRVGLYMRERECECRQQTAGGREQVAEGELVMLCWGNDQLFNVRVRLQGSKLDHGGLFQGYGKQCFSSVFLHFTVPAYSPYWQETEAVITTRSLQSNKPVICHLCLLWICHFNNIWLVSACTFYSTQYSVHSSFPFSESWGSNRLRLPLSKQCDSAEVCTGLVGNAYCKCWPGDLLCPPCLWRTSLRSTRRLPAQRQSGWMCKCRLLSSSHLCISLIFERRGNEMP